MRTGTLAATLLFAFGFVGLDASSINVSHAGEIRSEIAKLKQGRGGNYVVTVKDGSRYFFRNRIVHKVVIDGKTAKQADLRVGMACRLEYTSRKRNERLDITLIDCAKSK